MTVLADLLTCIDMSTLTHSELLSLSLLSHPTHSSNDAVLHHHHHSSPTCFNISASTHQQTFSNFPLKHRRRRHRRGFSLLKQERLELTSILNFLHLHLGGNPRPRLKKTKSKTKTKTNDKNISVVVEMVNRNGVVVDLEALAAEEGDLYGEELKRRAAGMEREDELLKMLAVMEGGWCSRRKKRRVVDACLLGDALPVGWKIIIALRRKASRFFPYCRRYVSPTGEQFSSCKELSSYLKSCFGTNDVSFPRDASFNFQQSLKVYRDKESCINREEGNSLLDTSNSTAPNMCVPIKHGNDVSALNLDNLSEVQIRDLYECHSCDVSFDDKDKYLQHLMSYHQKTTRRYQLGSSVGVVTFGDRKYKCRFCSEVFKEQCHCLVHVGPHAKDSAKQSDDSSAQLTDSSKSPCLDQLTCTTGVSRTDALIEVAETSIPKIRPSVLEKESLTRVNGDNPPKIFKLGVVDFMTGKNSISYPAEPEMKKGSEVKTSSEELNFFEKVSGISNECLDKTGVEKVDGTDNTSSVMSIPTCNEIKDFLITKGDVNDSGACSIELEKGSDQDGSSPGELSPNVKEAGMSKSDGDKVDFSKNELEMKKDAQQCKLFSEELNQLDKVGDALLIDAEMRKRSRDRELSAINCDFDKVALPAAESGGLHAVDICGSELASAKIEGSSVEPKGLSSIHYEMCKKRLLDMDGAGDIKSDNVNKNDPGKVLDDDERELAYVYISSESNVSGVTEPQKFMYLSSTSDGTFGKAGQTMCGHDQNFGSEVGPDYMDLDVIESHVSNTMSRGNSIFLSDISMHMENSTRVQVGLDSSIGSQSESQLSMGSEGLMTTFCVWCGIEFCHEVVELQPDSVGFMCPTCRSKISKQFNELESNFTLNSSYC